MKPIIKKDRVVLQEGTAPRPAPAAPRPSPGPEPVRLLRAGGVVHALEVRCACCGEVAVIELEYDSGPAADPQAAGSGAARPSSESDPATSDPATSDPATSDPTRKAT